MKALLVGLDLTNSAIIIYMNLDLAFKLAMQSPLMARNLVELIAQRKVRHINSLATTYTRTIVEMHADKIFDVTFNDGTQEILHIEIQGKHSHRDMALRVFDYITRIISQSGNLKTSIRSVVIYVGEGAGADDDGKWEFGEPSIGFFQYRVIKLWQYDADEWLAMDIPALLPLIAQTRMDEPEQQLQQAMERIYQLEDAEEVANLLYILSAMIKEKGLQTMVQTFISKHEIMESPPIIRDFYLKGQQEGHAEGRAEGILQGKVHYILKLLQLTIQQNLSKYDYAAIKNFLTAMDEATLDKAFQQAASVSDLAAFKAWLEAYTS